MSKLVVIVIFDQGAGDVLDVTVADAWEAEAAVAELNAWRDTDPDSLIEIRTFEPADRSYLQGLLDCSDD